MGPRWWLEAPGLQGARGPRPMRVAPCLLAWCPLRPAALHGPHTPGHRPRWWLMIKGAPSPNAALSVSQTRPWHCQNGPFALQGLDWEPRFPVCSPGGPRQSRSAWAQSGHPVPQLPRPQEPGTGQPHAGCSENPTSRLLKPRVGAGGRPGVPQSGVCHLNAGTLAGCQAVSGLW